MSMHLTRLRLEQVRKFQQPFELNDLARGLNIFTGPNEAGKSTLVRAIRAVFFERYRSKSVHDLQPWSDGSASPCIAIDFSHGGLSYQVRKTFLAKMRCDLRIGAERLDSGDAEDHLARLFGFGFAAKGASKPEHWGIPGLLWIEQGAGHQLREPANSAHDYLHEALQGHDPDASTSALTASRGDELLFQLKKERAVLLTPTGKPTGAYADVLKLVDLDTVALAELDAQVATYRHQVDQLAALRSQYLQDEAKRPWDTLSVALAQASQTQTLLAESERQLEGDRGRLSQLARQRLLLVQQIEGFSHQRQEATRREQALLDAATRLQNAEPVAAMATAQAEHARLQGQQARVALQQARQEGLRSSLLHDMAAHQGNLARDLAVLDRSQLAQQSLTELRQQTGNAAPTKAVLETLRQLNRQVRELRLQLQTVATHVQFTLQSGQQLVLQTEAGTQTLQGHGEFLLSGSASLDIPSLGSLTLTPGGLSVKTLAAELATAQDALALACQKQGVADLAEAEQRFSTQTDVQTRITLAEQTLSVMVPDGVDQLQARIQVGQAHLQASHEAALRLPARALAAVLPVAEAELAHEAAAVLETAANEALASARLAHSLASSRVGDAQRECDVIQAALADPLRQRHQAEAQTQLLGLQAEMSALDARIEQLAASLIRAQPDAVRQDIQRLSGSITQLKKSHQDRSVQIQLLQNTLQQANALDLEDRREALAARLVRAVRRNAELQLRAGALELLCGKLEARRQAKIAQLQAPLQRHIQRYLALLFPGASLSIDNQLFPDSMQRPGANGRPELAQFDALSFGAREQLGLISRFAYADLLLESNRPTLLILDDALVHSDSVRLGQMKRVIFDVAQRHQVLMFTCHPEDWQDMGVEVKALSAASLAAAPFIAA